MSLVRTFLLISLSTLLLTLLGGPLVLRAATQPVRKQLESGRHTGRLPVGANRLAAPGMSGRAV
ncbi:hypothetical protein CDA63_02625 [Hymenobacter amundsenii]|uniref:Uncharacterized protein n=1 Tax=Hymenobacter amundsenii TaxID=2006685 RepID=A0A246FPK2_9BACT|nr:hypothetical protein [Hymenobacter amundsenii]OWP64673.1 hypothetical protein CDA63_02625 [Hymenobacter amundsenii]